MNFLNIHTDLLRSEEYLGAEPVERATWLNLLAWCATQENSGVIEGCKKWTDRKWQQICGITKEEAEEESDLYGFEDDDLIVNFYPIESEKVVKAKREAGKRGGRPRNDSVDDESGRGGKPPASPDGIPIRSEEQNHEVNHMVNHEVKQNETITEPHGEPLDNHMPNHMPNHQRNVKKGKDKDKDKDKDKGKENENENIPPKSPKGEPPSEQEFVNYCLETIPTIHPQWEPKQIELCSLGIYRTYIEQGWKDGNGKKITNWKTTIRNKFKYEKHYNYGQSNTSRGASKARLDGSYNQGRTHRPTTTGKLPKGAEDLF